MTLYEIDKGILECVDIETGEVIDPERLNALNMERERKIEGVACWYKNLISDAEAIKAEKNSLSEREEQCRKKAESLKQWISAALEGQKFQSAKCAVSFRKSTRVEIEDPGSIPKNLMVESVTLQPNKIAIKEILKSGQEVSGCRLVEGINPTIK